MRPCPGRATAAGKAARRRGTHDTCAQSHAVGHGPDERRVLQTLQSGCEKQPLALQLVPYPTQAGAAGLRSASPPPEGTAGRPLGPPPAAGWGARRAVPSKLGTRGGPVSARTQAPRLSCPHLVGAAEPGLGRLLPGTDRGRGERPEAPGCAGLSVPDSPPGLWVHRFFPSCPFLPGGLRTPRSAVWGHETPDGPGLNPDSCLLLAQWPPVPGPRFPARPRPRAG